MNYQRKLFLSCLVLFLTACGGGGGGNAGPIIQPPPPSPPPTSGISRTGIAAGTISNFGSVIVNGVRYETGSTAFTINGASGSQDDLSVGQFVVVKGEINDDLTTGTANEIDFNDNVKGPVQLIDIAQQRLVVLGQTVFVNTTTSFDDNISGGSLNGLNEGDIVEVSGLVNADGAVIASRIEKKPAGTVFEVLGLVSNHDAATRQFAINALTVDYSAAQLDDFPSGAIENGQLVEAKGTGLGQSGELLATQVEFKNPNLTGADGVYIEIEGFVTRFVSAADFDVGGVPVITNASTLFEGGVAADLGLNIKVEVEGDFNATGAIVAEKVQIKRAKAVRVTATIDLVDAPNNTFEVLGIPVTIDALTRLEDKSDLDIDPLTINNLSAGNYVEVRGGELPAGSGMILATIVERDDLDSDIELQGFVTAFADPTITVLGVTIETGSAVFRDANNNPISRAEFFGQLSINSLIEAKGVESGTTVITAQEVEFEIED